MQIRWNECLKPGHVAPDRLEAIGHHVRIALPARRSTVSNSVRLRPPPTPLPRLATKMHRITSLWLALRSSLWFLPSLILCFGVLAAIGLIELQPVLDVEYSKRWPRLFGAGAEGSRGMLSAIATSMITVAGVVFSITVVALSLAASQYSPRVLRNFMSDRPTQAVLGAFVAIFAYCLIVLRTVRGPEEGGFVPSLAVLGGVVMAFVGVFLLVYFVHHVASSIQVSSILERIATETREAIGRLFPEQLGSPAKGADRHEHRALSEAWSDIVSARTGYLVGVDSDGLLARAEEHSLVVQIVPRVGEYVIENLPVLRVAGSAALDARGREELLACLSFGRQRTVHQDAPFGLQQIVDIALKALSPGIHDPSTAISCIDQLGGLMVAMAARDIPGPFRSSKGQLRLVAEGPDFASMLALSFDAVTDHAADHAEVYASLLQTLDRIAAATPCGARRRLVIAQLDVVLESATRAGLAPWRHAALERQWSAVRARAH